MQQVVSDSYDALTAEEDSRELSEEQREVLALYHGSFDDDRVNHGLVVAIIEEIERSSRNVGVPASDGSAASGIEDGGAILVFLPGYDDIVTLRWIAV